MARLAVRYKSVRINEEDTTVFVDSKKKPHQYAVQLGIDLKTGEVTGALVVDIATDKEWFLLSEKRLARASIETSHS